MNYRGSYRKLLGNAKAAMIAAIEIYNKPVFRYRDECTVILLLNAWELILKALLSENKKSIFYIKRRNQPYRTLTWHDALLKARPLFPIDIQFLPIQRNLELLGTYRDNAVHFYNAKDFGIILYALSQTSIKNFRDLLESAFGIKLENEINWQLLPLAIKPPIDVISYISKTSADKMTGAVRQFLSELAEAVDYLKAAGEDTGRLMTVFNVKLESIKKIGDADIVVGIRKTETGEGPLALVRTQDPNVTHPLRRKDILESIETLQGKRFTSYIFQAIVWKNNFKENMQYCWHDKEGALTKYSNDVIPFINRITKTDLEIMIKDYREYIRLKHRMREG